MRVGRGKEGGKLVWGFYYGVYGLRVFYFMAVGVSAALLVWAESLWAFQRFGGGLAGVSVGLYRRRPLYQIRILAFI